MKPDAYIMIESNHMNNNMFLFVYGVTHKQVSAVFNMLICRTGLNAMSPIKTGSMQGLASFISINIISSVWEF
ncbi:MAG: hypothetical protein GPOALKHO_001660 [Sodalis sp.]|nr:MAG: hypothetical protein GPOALKHO_001660 [Sodalis sp.]